MLIHNQSPHLQSTATRFSPGTAPQTISFPENLRDWMGEPQLAMMVADTAEEMPHPSAQFKVLLAVITYSYATGIYPSAEIESSLRQSRHPFACPDEEWEHAIRSYRRMHHAKIERSLAEVLRRCFCYYDGEREIHPPGPDHFGEDPFTREAVARVARAIRFDSSALDF